MKVCFGSYIQKEGIDPMKFGSAFGKRLADGIRVLTKEAAEVVHFTLRDEITEAAKSGAYDLIITECHLKDNGSGVGSDIVGFGTIKKWVAFPNVKRVLLIFDEGMRPKLSEDNDAWFASGKKTVDLWKQGYYDGIFLSDVSAERIVDLYNNGRTMEEAKTYYGITDEMISEKSEKKEDLAEQNKESEPVSSYINIEPQTEEKTEEETAEPVEVDAFMERLFPDEETKVSKESIDLNFLSNLSDTVDSLFSEEEKESTEGGFVFDESFDPMKEDVQELNAELSTMAMEPEEVKTAEIVEELPVVSKEPKNQVNGIMEGYIAQIAGSSILIFESVGDVLDAELSEYSLTGTVDTGMAGRIVNGRYKSGAVVLDGYGVRKITPTTFMVEITNENLLQIKDTILKKPCSFFFSKIEA